MRGVRGWVYRLVGLCNICLDICVCSVYMGKMYRRDIGKQCANCYVNPHTSSTSDFHGNLLFGVAFALVLS